MIFNELFWGGIWFMWIFRFVVIALIIWLIVNAVNKNQPNKYFQQQPETALDILKKRYAKGEISKEQFDRMKTDIQ